MNIFFYKKLIKIYKVFKSNKGVNITEFTTIIAIGDKNGGLGVGKFVSTNQSVSIIKALSIAKKNFFKVFLEKFTFSHPIIGKYGKCLILVFPLKNKYNFSCGGPIRSILEVMGIYNLSVKIYGSNNFYNILKAFLCILHNFNSKNFILLKRL